MARLLAAAGYRVIAVARNEHRGARRARRPRRARPAPAPSNFAPAISPMRPQIKPLVRALREPSSGRSTASSTMPGSAPAGCLGTMRDDEIERLIRLNTISPDHCSPSTSRASMMSERNGRIVNIASIVASTGYSGLSVYSATKASLLGFTRSLARELGPLGITVNAIAPGFIDTAMTHELDAAQRERIARRSALQAHGRADRCGAQRRVPARRRAVATSPARCSRWMPATPPEPCGPGRPAAHARAAGRRMSSAA